jgi:hypothetical protein
MNLKNTRIIKEIMTKEEIAKELAKEIYKLQAFTKYELEDVILKNLTKILHADKGRLHKGTIQ